MKTITNPKLISLKPGWAAYRGFSLLFDNPGGGCTPAGAGLLKLDCQPNESLALYKAFGPFLQEINLQQLQDEFSFCPLPFYSYHVTVWDGLNEGNLPHLEDDAQESLRAYLENMPALLFSPNQFTTAAHQSPLARQAWQIELVYTGLAKWSNQSLVALLGPKDRESQKVFVQISNYRRQLNAGYRETFGVKMRDGYHPHVTLGYFANQDMAARATPYIEMWETILRDTVAGLKISFSTISLYGFDDMVTFYKKG
jgi:hypothetical protein